MRVSIWRGMSEGSVLSSREYIRVDMVIDTTDYDGESTSVDTVYEDYETGLIVHDVEKFERWIDKLEQRV